MSEAIKELPLMELFYTIQGEGFHAGRAATFIRLGGCDVGCVWCDVKESWNAEEHPFTSVDNIVNEVARFGCKFVVITGGEPAMYDLSYLTSELKKLGTEIAIETSGVYPIKGTFDWICFSPKKFKAPHETSFAKANELKVIINHPSDFEWASQHAQKVSDSCKLYLQTEWSKRDRFNNEIVEYVKNHPQWNISLQTHKYLDIP